MKRFVAALLFSISIAHADEIYLKTGFILKNVSIVEKTSDGFVRFRTKNDQQRVRQSDILFIREAEFNPNMPMETGKFDPSQMPDSLSQQLPVVAGAAGTVIVTHPNLKLLPLSIVAFGLSWDYFTQASDLADIPGAESDKTRKTILGVAFLAAGIANTAISLQTVEVKASPSSIAIAYKF